MDIENQTFYLTQPQLTDTGPISSSADPTYGRSQAGSSASSAAHSREGGGGGGRGGGCRGTTDVLMIFFQPSLSSASLRVLARGSSVHSLMLSCQHFFGLPRLLPPGTVPCMTVFASPVARVTCPYHLSFLVLTMERRSSCGPMATGLTHVYFTGRTRPRETCTEKAGLEPNCSALQADTFTTGPTRQSSPRQKDRLVGLVVKPSAFRAEDPGFEPRLRWDFSGVESYQ